MELFSEIKAIIAKLLSIDPETVIKEAHLHFDLGADSLAIVNLSIAISEKYKVELLAEDRLRRIRSGRHTVDHGSVDDPCAEGVDAYVGLG